MPYEGDASYLVQVTKEYRGINITQVEDESEEEGLIRIRTSDFMKAYQSLERIWEAYWRKIAKIPKFRKQGLNYVYLHVLCKALSETIALLTALGESEQNANTITLGFEASDFKENLKNSILNYQDANFDEKTYESLPPVGIMRLLPRVDVSSSPVDIIRDNIERRIKYEARQEDESLVARLVEKKRKEAIAKERKERFSNDPPPRERGSHRTKYSDAKTLSKDDVRDAKRAAEKEKKLSEVVMHRKKKEKAKKEEKDRLSAQMKALAISHLILTE